MMASTSIGADETIEPPKSSGKKLDAETIITAGLSIAARPGAKSISVRELGALLGTDPTAIYRHFRSKDDLMRAMLDRITGLAIDRAVTDPSDWQGYLREMAEHTLDVFLEYPVIGAQAMRLSTEGERELQSIEGLLAAFRAAGLDGDQLVRYYGVMSGFVLSFCSGIVTGRSVDDVDGHDATNWIDRPLNVTTASHPEITQSREALLSLNDRDIYAKAINVVIEAAARDGAIQRAATSA
jgi:AcrR family transcriptional regulator